MKSKHFTAESVNACVRNPVWNSVSDPINKKVKTYEFKA